jgi:hypothetical protein
MKKKDQFEIDKPLAFRRLDDDSAPMPVEKSGEHTAKKISLKYEGRCVKCGRKIPAGETAYWGGFGNRICQRCAQDTRREMLAPFEEKNKMKKSRIEHVRARNFYAIVSAIVVIAFVLGGFVLGPFVTPTPTVTTTLIVTEASTVITTVTVPEGVTQPPPPPDLKWLPRNPSDPEVVSWADAGRYVGKTKTVEGTIVRTYRSSTNTIFLNFHDPYQGYFCGVIFASDLSSFPFKPEDFYRGKEVRISGLIKLY